jgi:aminotransferase in exopolysaccharide biosynthesis
MFESFVRFVRQLYGSDEFIALHEPRFWGNEKRYVTDAIDSTFVSSTGQYVVRFEQMVAELTGSRFAIAVVNGTSALHAALILSGVRAGDLVLTQPLTFVATCNAIRYCGADPVFVDVDEHTLGMSPRALIEWLDANTVIRDGTCVHSNSGRRVSACVPMHTFGFALEIEAVVEACEARGIAVVEDAAESLGSYRGDRHTGTWATFGTLSFNGNKVVTTGGGGAILTQNEALAKHAKHLTTTGKKPHPWAFHHDEVAFNYRMPNLNAALGCAQLEQLPMFIERKRWLAEQYRAFFSDKSVQFLAEPSGTRANYWLNVVRCNSRDERDSMLEFTNARGVMTRPAWTLMTELPMYANCMAGEIPTAKALADTVVNIPSSVIKP